jgi:transcriptional regulator with XRE-family HTH domain
MPAPKEVADRLHKHFSEVSSEQFRENVRRYCPEITASDTVEAAARTREETPMGQLVLFQPRPSPLPLNAYLACGLTGLTREQRQLMFHLSDTIAMLCKAQNIDLYEPRKNTDPVHHADVHDAEVFRIDRERVLSADLLIYLCHYPSTGAGEELDIAYNALVPIILISHSETRVSRMVTGIPAFKLEITYTEPEELRLQLRDRLLEIRPILEERKMAFSKYEANIVGDKIRELREVLGLTREEVARSIPHLTVDALRHIEESIDRHSNPSLMQLRQIATILKTTVADLVEPDLSERVIAVLQDWVTGRPAAARFPGFSIKDRNRIIRRILLRVIDSLEEQE